MRKSLFIPLCLIARACPKNEESAPAARAPGAGTTTGAPTDAKNMRVDTVIPAAPVFFDKAFLSTQVNAEGNTAVDETMIAKGKPAYFTMHVRESPVGLATRAVWLDANRKEISKEERDMKGSKVATFKLDTKKLAPGKYVAQGYWGGNLAVEKEFEIAAAAASPTKKKK
jgi:hypothetical protein